MRRGLPRLPRNAVAALSAGPLPFWIASETFVSLAQATELRADESAVSSALRAALFSNTLGERAPSCARARRRPARAQFGLRVRSRVRGGPLPGLWITR